jgi:hypothetical protein
MFRDQANPSLRDVTTPGSGVSRQTVEIYPGSEIVGAAAMAELRARLRAELDMPPSVPQQAAPASKPKAAANRKPAAPAEAVAPTGDAEAYGPITMSEPVPLAPAVPVQRSRLTAEPPPVKVKASFITGIAPEVALYAPPKRAPKKAAAKPAPPPVTPAVEIAPGSEIAGGTVVPPVVALPAPAAVAPAPVGEPVLVELAVDAAAAGPYAAAADWYSSHGWEGVLPLPAGAKKLPPSGYTGKTGKTPTTEEVEAWKASRGAGNIALRMPANVVAIDVDGGYVKDGELKTGEVTLAALEAELGALPPTWIASSRAPELSPLVAGKRFFRLPDEYVGRAFRDFDGDVDLLHHGHRYAVVWPSTNPDSGGSANQWFSQVPGMEFTPGALPLLPAAWCEHITSRPAGAGAGTPAKAKGDKATKPAKPAGQSGGNAANPDDAWIVLACMTNGEPTPGLRATVAKKCELFSVPANRHTNVLRAVNWALGCGAEGAQGVAWAVAELRHAFAYGTDPGEEGYEHWECEFDKMLQPTPALITMLRDTAARHGRIIGETVADGIIEPPADVGDNAEGTEESGLKDWSWLYTVEAADAAGWARLPEVNALGHAVHAWHDQKVYPKGHPHAPDLIEAIFNYSDVTRFWLHKARGYHAAVGPVAAYLTWLVRLGVRLPPTFGVDNRPAPLNISRYGLSGGGKSSTMTCALSVPCPDPPWYQARYHEKVLHDAKKPNWDTRHALGSGEVLRDLYTEKDAETGDLVWKAHPVVWIEEAESEAFYARAAKAGATIIQELNKCFNSETPGTSTKTSGFEDLEDRDFSLYWTGAIQDTVWPRLQGAMSGWNQRNLACSTDDVWAAYPCSVPPPPVGYTPPGLPELPGPAGIGGFTFCETVHTATREWKAAVGLVPVEATDGRESHRLLKRKRLAAHVALAHGTTHVDDAIWEHTGYLMEHFDRVVAMADAAAARVIDADDLEKGRKMSVTDSGRMMGNAALADEAKRGIIDSLRASGGTLRKEDCRLSLSSRVRGHFVHAVEKLQSEGTIATVKQGRATCLSLSSVA